MAEAPTRIEEARRRAGRAKQRLGLAAAASFLVAAVLAWVSHPGTSSAATASVDSTASTSDDGTTNDGFFGFDSGAIGPSSSTPQVQTHVS